MYYVYTNCKKSFFSLKIDLPIKLIFDYEKFKAISSSKKIIFYRDDLFVYEDEIDSYNVIQKYESFCQCSSLVFSINSEFFNQYVNLFEKLTHLKNLYIMRPGLLNYYTKINFLHNPHFFYWQNYLYEDSLETLNQTYFIREKEYFFDCLLGKEKKHRNFINDFYQISNHKNKIIFNYSDIKSDSWLQVNDIEFQVADNISHTIFTTAPVLWNKKVCTISQVIPLDIYTKSAYSIIAETYFSNDYSYFSEKTAKPLMTKRLFVVFSGYNFLKNLKKLGFKTFNSVIDESYDEEIDDYKRWKKAWQQVEYLCSIPQENVYKKIQPILEHNFNNLLNTKWINILGNQVREIIKNHNFL